MTIIYALLDPDTLCPRYIGKTRQPLNRRLRQHIRGTAENNPRVREWIDDLLSDGLTPLIKVIGRVEDGECFRAEREAIKDALAQGHPILNMKNNRFIGWLY